MMNAKYIILPEGIIPRKTELARRRAPSHDDITAIAEAIARQQDENWPDIMLEIPGHEKKYFIETVWVKKENDESKRDIDIFWKITPSSGSITQFPLTPATAAKLIWLNTVGIV